MQSKSAYTKLSRLAAAHENEHEDTLRTQMLPLYELYLDHTMENLTGNTSKWDALAKLIDGQAVHGFSTRAAAGLLKVLINAKSEFSLQVARRKTH